jgi:hypothetical protein
VTNKEFSICCVIFNRKLYCIISYIILYFKPFTSTSWLVNWFHFCVGILSQEVIKLLLFMFIVYARVHHISERTQGILNTLGTSLSRFLLLPLLLLDFLLWYLIDTVHERSLRLQQGLKSLLNQCCVRESTIIQIDCDLGLTDWDWTQSQPLQCCFSYKI